MSGLAIFSYFNSSSDEPANLDVIIVELHSCYNWVGDTILALAMFCFSNYANWLASF